MSKKKVNVMEQVRNLLDPMKTALAVRSRDIPPLICLVCVNSGEIGKCTLDEVDVNMVMARWNQQLTISEVDFQERLKPGTRLTNICIRFKQ